MRTLPPHCGGLETEEPLSLWAQGVGSTVGAESGVRVLWRGSHVDSGITLLYLPAPENSVYMVSSYKMGTLVLRKELFLRIK